MAGGRQREFNKDEALRDAMHVFWKKGFVGASLTDLTQGMGINKPSMYAAFGNKEQLFVQATQYYLEHNAEAHIKHLHMPDQPLKDRLKGYMLSAVSAQCDPDSPKGCYISLCVSEAASECIPDDAEAAITTAKNNGEDYLRNFFADEQHQGHIAKDVDCDELALYVMTVLHGTAAMARGGKSLQELLIIIDYALGNINQMME
ncbi:TetR/AcrR family transcriptional regulator [Marinicella sp. W31]|uniref:TetR/AcrR family transcriptional regulator n=1 Tax=Marinicella sp. W31 TaxID=3023713 RepID=UPI0037575415